MKAFEKQFEKYRPGCGSCDYDEGRFDGLEEGWRAALGWILEEVLLQDEDGCPSISVSIWWMKDENIDKCYIPVKRIVEEFNS